MTVYKTTAEVFFGGRRRWFSLKTAARREAMEVVRARYACQCESVEYDPGGNPVYPGYDCGNHNGDVAYDKMVRRLARIYEAASKVQKPAPTSPEARALAACRELLAARKEVERISHLIGDNLNACPLMKDPIEYGPKGPVTHLAMAYASEDIENDHGHGGTHKEWNNQHLLDDCPHCLAAHNAIQERKLARRRLGAARRAITLIGKS